MIFDRGTSLLKMNLEIDNKALEQVNNFDFLGLNISEALDWSSQTIKICNKLSRNIGILRRLRCQLPPDIMKLLYYALVHSHLTYMILVWGNDSQQILTKQKKAIRIIHSKYYLSHTEPLFRASRILKVTDLHTQQQLQFCRKYITGKLPEYFKAMEFRKNCDNHNYNTTHRNMYIAPKPKTENSRKMI